MSEGPKPVSRRWGGGSRLQFAACLGVTLLALWWVFSSVDFEELRRAFSKLSPSWIPALVAVYLSSFVFRAWRWKLTLAPVGQVSWRASGQAVMLGYAANNILPGRLGELVRAVALSTRTTTPSSTALVSILVERIFDATTLLLFLGLSLTQLPESSQSGPLFSRLGLLAVVVCAAAMTAIFVGRIALRWSLGMLGVITCRLPSGIGVKLMTVAENGMQALRFIDISWRFLLIVVLGLVTWAAEAAVFWMAAYAMGLSTSVWLALFAVSVVNFSILVPAAPGYVGVFQAAGVYAFGMWGIEQSPALACAILIHAVQYFPVTLIGAGLLPTSGFSLHQVRAAGSQTPGNPTLPSSTESSS